jgi:hypothetical protein
LSGELGVHCAVSGCAGVPGGGRARCSGESDGRDSCRGRLVNSDDHMAVGMELLTLFHGFGGCSNGARHQYGKAQV